jgi:adenosylmethionine-8-amino-7-oxononanoate aminotransferase
MAKTETKSHVFTLDPTHYYPTVVSGEGPYVTDDQGKKYLDAIAGIGVSCIGYGRKRVADAMAAQAQRISYAASNVFSNQPSIQLASQLAALTPGDLQYFQFTSGGSEANEVCIKLSRQYHLERGHSDKHKMVSRWISYHGATIGALTVSGMAGRRKMYLPLLQDWPHIPPAYCYRCPFEMSYPACGVACAHALEEKIQEVGADTLMGFIAEPVVGAAGGALVPPPEYWPTIREICDRYDLLLIADEVFTGFGRTGRNFAVDHWNVVPDMITMAKGISGGYAPLGAVAISSRIRATFENNKSPFNHIFTYSGSPIATAAASEVLRIWEEENLVQHAATIGRYFLQQLATLKEHRSVGDVRGLGLFAGIEFVQDQSTKEPFPSETLFAKKVAQIAFENGLTTYPSSAMADGVRGDAISLFPPLIITEQHVDECVSKLHDALTKVEQSLGIK